MNFSNETLDPSFGDAERVRNEFNAGLDKLTFNCRNTIHGLTKYAESRIASAPVLVDALQQRIYKANTSNKLPYMYLLDSIVKNVGKAYVPLFSKDLKQLFLENFVTLQDDKLKRSFLKVLQTWRFVFDRSLITSIEREIFGPEVPDNYSDIPPESLTLMKQMIGLEKAEVPSQSTVKPVGTTSISSAALEQSAALLASLQALNLPLINPLAQPPASHESKPAPQIKANIAPASTRRQPAAPLPESKHSAPDRTRRPPSSAGRQRPSQPSGSGQMPSTRSQPSMHAPLPPRARIEAPPKFTISTEFINKKYPNAHQCLYKALRLTCKNCGLRFEDSSQSRQRLAIHLDWHFKRNRRIKERLKKPISRDWFPTAKEWLQAPISFEDSLSVVETQAPFTFPTGTSDADSGSAPLSPSSQRHFDPKLHTVPTRVAYDMKECNLCGDKFALAWNEEDDEWVYENAVLDAENGGIFHFSCSTNDSQAASKRKRYE